MGKSAADIITWDQYKILLEYLERDNKLKLLMYALLGGMLGIKSNEILKLTWNEVLGSSQQTEKSLQLNDNLIVMVERVYNKMNNPEKSESIFLNQYKKQIVTLQYLNRKLKELAKNYGLNIEHFTTHSFRKMFGRKILEENGYSKDSLEYLRLFFGHPNVGSIKDYLDINNVDIPKNQVIKNIKL